MSKLPRLALASIAVLFASTSARAEGPAGDDFVDPLDTHQGAMPTAPTPPAPSDVGMPSHPQFLGAKVMYVNFDGADMNSCNNNDPQNNCSTIFGGTVLEYSGDAAKRASIIQVVRKRVADFGVTVTDQRPASGDYDMEMVGDWANSNPPFAGVAPSIDCFDSRGGETSFTLEASGTTDGTAEIILQEIAHTWGLEHVDDVQDLLYPTTEGQNKVFKDECIKIVRLEDNGTLTPVNGGCNSVHTAYCNSGWQNSYRELLQIFGPAVPDTSPPTVEILTPADGEMIDGGDLELRVRFEDNQSPVIINASILIESASLVDGPITNDGAYAGPSELDFPINGLPDGEYTVTIDAQDEDDNPASDAVTFTVVGNPPNGGEEGGGETSAGSSGGETGGETGGGEAGGETGGGEAGGPGTGTAGGGEAGGDVDGDDSTDTDGPGGSQDDAGCGCHAPSQDQPMGVAALGLFAIGLLRRRRVARA